MPTLWGVIGIVTKDIENKKIIAPKLKCPKMLTLWGIIGTVIKIIKNKVTIALKCLKKNYLH
jgi:hypothetical protein